MTNIKLWTIYARCHFTLAAISEVQLTLNTLIKTIVIYSKTFVSHKWSMSNSVSLDVDNLRNFFKKKKCFKEHLDYKITRGVCLMAYKMILKAIQEYIVKFCERSKYQQSKHLVFFPRWLFSRVQCQLAYIGFEMSAFLKKDFST